ncbi:sensor histidine kinase [Flammeovirga kamogawensis]|uniref:Histidine kinase n=2 Tax=Flammeovirga kamogawensis TaxID=373891 RepID=A0ABX8H3Y7_9BACT|nr:histidine kinase [Flammeovirga kamogawensis]MBB6460230.1 sensor histidine kinase YesM [Flammeovirga kamogawensis]QWG10042.1 histidine kinase [Flammeovirga kamogawensis]TRX65549.1 hypothetical protein EO216_23810 [Flammeovirga kamogawensis]
MILLERNYKWLQPVLSISISLILLVFTYWSINSDFDMTKMFSYMSTYLYLLWFNGFVYLSTKFTLFFDKFLPFEKHSSLRLTVELVSLFLMAFIFFYIVMVILNINGAIDEPHVMNKNNTIIGIFHSLVLLLYSSLTITDNFLRKWRTDSLKIEVLKQDKLRAENRALQAQLNPHFLFNSLNVIISEIDHDPKLAKQFALDLSHTYRYVLQSKDVESVTFETEWEAMQAYIHLHQVRLGEGLKVLTSIDELSNQKKIPPLSIQLLLENCFKHNQATLRKPLMITIFSDGNQFSIENNKQPKNKSADTYNIGIQYLKESFKQLDQQTSIYVEENETTFKITIPLIEA